MSFAGETVTGVSLEGGEAWVGWRWLVLDWIVGGRYVLIAAEEDDMCEALRRFVGRSLVILEYQCR
jgi:hypothetical protein